MLKEIVNLKYHHQLLLNVAKGAVISAVATNISGGIIVSYLLFDIVPWQYLLLWVSGNVSVLLSRIYTAKKFIKSNDTKSDINFLKITSFLIIINSLLYSFMLFLAVIYEANDIVMIMLIFPIVALISGSISTLGSVYFLFFLYNSINIFLLVAVLIFHGGEMFIFLVFMLATFYAVYIVSGYKYYITIRNSLSLNDTFKILYDESPNGIVLMQNNRFIDCNTSILNMFKYETKESFLTTHISKLSPLYQPDGQLSTRKMLQMTKKTTYDNTNSFEWIHTDTDNKEFWCQTVLTKIYLEGEEYIYGVWQNISSSKELEMKQKVLLQEIENSNNSLLEKVKQEVEKNRKKDQQLLSQSRFAQMGEMISMIAHQWRQPLSAISSRSMGIELKAKLGVIDSDFIIDNCRHISQYTQHLSSTIDDFRNFFKTNKKKTDFTYNEIIDSALNIMQTSIINKDIEIDTQLNSKLIFNTFKNELKQVFINIIKNAEDVLIDNNTKDAKITILTNNDELIIKDNAGGIDEDIIDKIFDPYFSTKLGKNGTGLGLYMSKIIIEEHCNGSLSVENDKDGAVFKIKLNTT